MRRNDDSSPPNAHPSTDDANKDQNQPDTTNNASVYSKFELGLLQSLLMFLTKSAKASLYLTIAINAIMNTSDTASDIGMFNVLMSRDLRSIAFILLAIDYLPGILVNLHQLTSSSWKEFTRTQQIGSVLLLIVQPFSVMVTSVSWMFNIQSDHRHYLSRLSSVIHGHLESPLQMAFFIYMWSKGYLRTPWEETSRFVDRNGNAWSMGNVWGTMSLTLTIVGMIKGCLDSFESTDEKFKFFVFSSINMVYRIGSLSVYSQFFDDPQYLLMLLVPLLIVTYFLFLRRSGLQGKKISILSSVVCSIVVPVSATERPHDYQIKLESLNEERRKEETDKRKLHSDSMRQNSAILSFLTSQLFLVADLGVLLAVKLGDFKNTSIWTNGQLVSWVYQFFIPLYFASMLSSYSIYNTPDKHEEKDEAKCKESLVQKFYNALAAIKFHILANYLSLISVIATIITVALHTANLERTNSYLLAYKTDNHEINLLEGITSFDLKSLCPDGKCDLSPMNFTSEDYRKLPFLKNDTIYVSVNTTKLPSTFWLIQDGLDWDRIIVENEYRKICKKCLAAGSPQYQRCKTMAFEGHKIEDCLGAFTI